MSLLKNKHVMTAAIVTPVLALISYFAVDSYTGEKPHVAEKGRSYSLVEKPNCRYDSGRCGIKNGDFELDLVVEFRANGQAVLNLSSVHPLEGVMVAVLEEGKGDVPPRQMRLADTDGQLWSLNLEPFEPGQDRLRVAASAGESLYFGDVALKFVTQER